MEILIRGTKLEITDSMKDYVKEKLSKLDKYLVDQKAKANVLVKVHNYLQKIEVTIPLKTLILRAEEEQQDFYAAVDLVINKLERQIRKNKAKLQKRDKNKSKEFNIDDVHENNMLTPKCYRGIVLSTDKELINVDFFNIWKRLHKLNINLP